MGIRVAVDIGGTFTDFILVNDEGEVSAYKTPSTPSEPERAIMTGLDELASGSDMSLRAFLESVDLFIHGTTIATNTVIQRNGPKCAALVTEGFRDTLFLRDGHKPNRYDLHMPPPDPFIPRRLRLGVRERIVHTGEVIDELDEQSVRDAARIFTEEGVEAIAVCLLWSIVNPAHERRVRDLLEEEMPDAYVSLSSDILPAMREYQRAGATVLSSYVGPVLGEYLTKVADYLRTNGYRYDLLVMQVTGGSASVGEIEHKPVLAIGSGPAAGPPAGLAVGAEAGEQNLMVVDMGGTSFEVSVIAEGDFVMTRETTVEDMPIGVSAVDVHSIGAGGGSIAWIDRGGMLRVGPASAGAVPGPACYGLGGADPTVTDADLLLGYLNPEFFLGGRMQLDQGLAELAMRKVAEPLGLNVVEAAAAVYRIVNTNMVGAMRAVSVMRGIDPREYSIVNGGGAGGTHVTKIAEELGIGRALCPLTAGGLCAFGMLVADVRRSYLTTHPMRTDKIDISDLEDIFRVMEGQARKELGDEGFTDETLELHRFVDAKYPYQINELTVPLPTEAFSAKHGGELAEFFHSAHERLFTYAVRDMPVDMSGWRVTAIGKLPAIEFTEHAVQGLDPAAAQKSTRPIFVGEYGDFVEATVYDGASLRRGMSIAGPAVVELPTTTLLLFANNVLTVNPFGNYDIAISAADEAGLSA